MKIINVYIFQMFTTRATLSRRFINYFVYNIRFVLFRYNAKDPSGLKSELEIRTVRIARSSENLEHLSTFDLCLQWHCGTHLFYELAKSWRSSTRPRNPDLDRGLPSSIQYSVFLARAHRNTDPFRSPFPKREGSFSPSGTILTSHYTPTQAHD